MDVSALIARYPQLSFTTPHNVQVAFVPFSSFEDGTATHAYAVPYVSSGECLVTSRADGEWTLPGGTMETGETWQQTLHRELLEETGSRIDHFEPIGAYRCEGDAVTYRVVCWAEVTQIAEPADPDDGRPSAIVEVRQLAVDEARRLFTGRNHHYGAIYEISQLIRGDIP